MNHQGGKQYVEVDLQRMAMELLYGASGGLCLQRNRWQQKGWI